MGNTFYSEHEAETFTIFLAISENNTKTAFKWNSEFHSFAWVQKKPFKWIITVNSDE